MATEKLPELLTKTNGEIRAVVRAVDEWLRERELYYRTRARVCSHQGLERAAQARAVQAETIGEVARQLEFLAAGEDE